MELELSIETKDTGEVSVQRLPIEERVVLGRGPESPVALDGPLISREHIAFEIVGESLCVADLSANGSRLNGAQMQNGRRYPLTEADRVQLPGYEFRQRAGGAAPQRAIAPVEAAPVKSFLSSITATETTVLLVFGAAVAITVVFLQL